MWQELLNQILVALVASGAIGALIKYLAGPALKAMEDNQRTQQITQVGVSTVRALKQSGVVDVEALAEQGAARLMTTLGVKPDVAQTVALSSIHDIESALVPAETPSAPPPEHPAVADAAPAVVAPVLTEAEQLQAAMQLIASKLTPQPAAFPVTPVPLPAQEVPNVS